MKRVELTPPQTKLLLKSPVFLGLRLFLPSLFIDAFSYLHLGGVCKALFFSFLIGKFLKFKQASISGGRNSFDRKGKKVNVN